MAYPKKPTKLKLLEGTYRADRAVLNEAMPETAIPEAPKALRGEARIEWERITKELELVGLISNIDRTSLAVYCQAWAQWVKAQNEMAKLEDELGCGEVIKAPSGYLAINEWLKVSWKAAEQLDKFGAKFGMDPASRTKINTRPPEKDKQTRWKEFEQKRG